MIYNSDTFAKRCISNYRSYLLITYICDTIAGLATARILQEKL